MNRHICWILNILNYTQLSFTMVIFQDAFWRLIGVPLFVATSFILALVSSGLSKTLKSHHKIWKISAILNIVNIVLAYILARFFIM